MSGVPKTGIDFAGWDVSMFDNDPKIDKLLCSQGWTGFSIYFWLCMKAYGSEGYFYRWCYDDCASTARKMGSGISALAVQETVDYCLQISLFDEGRFVKWKILTSRGIQRRYWYVLQKRRVKKVYREFWMLDDEECTGLVKVSLKCDLHDANEYSQMTYKESKVKYSKDNNNIVETHLHDADDHLQTAYCPSDFERKCVDFLIRSILSDFPNQKVPKTENEIKKWAKHIDLLHRVDGISEADIWNTLVWTMKDSFWRTNIRSTGKFREKYQTLYLQSRRNGQNMKRNAFNDFPENHYNFEELEKELTQNL